MSRQTVVLRVPIDDAWDAGDRIQLYTDRGTGTVDTTDPLLVRPQEIFPGEIAARGYGVHPYGVGRAGDFKASRPSCGIETGVYGVTPYGTAPPFVEIEVDLPAAHGAWKFAIEVIDRDGTVQAGALSEIQMVVSGTEPSPLSAFAFNNYNAGSDQVTFDFTANTE